MNFTRQLAGSALAPAACVLAAAAWAPAAWGHPVGATIPSHQLTLTIAGGELTVDYSVRLPTPWIIEEIGERESFSPADGEAFTAGKLRELAGGLRVSVDGAPVPLELAPREEPTGLGDSKFLVYDLRLTGALPAGEQHTLELSQSNYPDQHAFFKTEVLLEPAARVESCSLFRIEDGRARFSRYGQWRMEEELRELRLRWSLPGGALERRARLAAAGGEGLLPATELVGAGELERLAAGELTRRSGLALGLGLGLLGLAAVRAGRDPAAWGVTLGILALAALAAVIGGAASAALGAAGALAAGAAVGAVSRWLGGRPWGRAPALVLAGVLALALGGLIALGL